MLNINQKNTTLIKNLGQKIKKKSIEMLIKSFIFIGIIIIIAIGVGYLMANLISSPRQKLIHKLQSNLDRVTELLLENYPQDEKVQRLYQRYYKKTKLFESIYDETYTLNKGEAISICLNNYNLPQSDGSLKIHEDLNLLIFVGLHEMAHIMSISIHHEPEFWDNFSFILENAVKWNIYQPIDYQYNPVSYCKMVIYDNPYFNERTPQSFGKKILTILKDN